jgi:hypothetical protein
MAAAVAESEPAIASAPSGKTAEVQEITFDSNEWETMLVEEKPVPAPPAPEEPAGFSVEVTPPAEISMPVELPPAAAASTFEMTVEAPAPESASVAEFMFESTTAAQPEPPSPPPPAPEPPRVVAPPPPPPEPPKIVAPPPAPEPPKVAAPPPPPPKPAAPPVAAAPAAAHALAKPVAKEEELDLLGDLVGDLEEALGEGGFGAPPAAAKPAAAPPPAPAPAIAKPAAAAASAAPIAMPAPVSPEAVPAGFSSISQIEHHEAASVLSDLFDEFKEDAEASAGEAEDPDTHYNLGIAFKEMGLLDEAIGELQKVCHAVEHGHPFSQTIQAYTWLAQCLVDKGVPQAAIRWYEKALQVNGINEDSRLAVYYDLGSAHELAGNNKKAYETFMEVYSSNIDYRDVADRLKSLKA